MVTAQNSGTEIFYEDFSGSNPEWYCFHDVTVNNGPSDIYCSSNDGSAYTVAGESGSATSTDGACGYGGIARDFDFSDDVEELEMDIKAEADNWGRNSIIIQDSDGYHVIWDESGSGSGNNIDWFTESFDISSFDSQFTLIIGNADRSSTYCHFGDHGFKTWGDNISIYGSSGPISISDSNPAESSGTSPASTTDPELRIDVDNIDSADVEFFENSPGSDSLGTDQISDGETAIYEWNNLESGETYEWSVEACDQDNDCVTGGPWTFEVDTAEWDLEVL